MFSLLIGSAPDVGLGQVSRHGLTTRSAISTLLLVLLSFLSAQGSSPGSPRAAEALNGFTFYAGYDETHGWELWKTNGTEAVLVKDIYPGSEIRETGGDPVMTVNSSNPHEFVIVNGTLYFVASNHWNGIDQSVLYNNDELWKSDGTEAGTVLVKEIHPGNSGSNPHSLTNVNGTLFFSAFDDYCSCYPNIYNYQIWKSDGTEVGTVRLTHIYNNSYLYPENLTNVEGELYFAYDDGVHGYELWKSDGTPSGTLLVYDINPYGNGFPGLYNYLDPFVYDNGTLYFTADDGIHGAEPREYVVPPCGLVNANLSITDARVCNGSDATITVTDSQTDFQYQVYSGNSAIGRAVSGGGTITLTIPAASLSLGSQAFVVRAVGCTSLPDTVRVVVEPLPSRPSVMGVSISRGQSATLVASGAPAGSTYRWYTQASGGSPISGTSGNTYTTPALSASTTYYVAIATSSCESERTAVTVTVTGESCTASGSILRELWSGVAGSSVASIPLTTPASSSSQLTAFETPVNSGDNYGERLRGYLCVPVTGNYTFWLASDNDGELWLSTNEMPANKRLIASVRNGFARPREWNKYASQRSAPLALVAGQRYYVEALHKESSGGDNLSVAWATSPTATPTVIPGSRLSAFVPACTASGSILRELWQGVPGSSVASIPLTTPASSSSQLTAFETPVNSGDNYGERLRGYLCVPATGNYTFWLASDNDGELWLSTNEMPANKRLIASVRNGFARPREWNKYASQRSAPLALVAGQRYYLEALHKESSGGDNLSVAWATSPTATPTVIPGSRLSAFVPACTASGSILRELWQGVPGSSVASIPLTTPASSSSQLTAFETPVNSGDNYGERLRGYLCVPATGNYTFWLASDNDGELWLSTNEMPANKRLIASVRNGFARPREWNKYASQRSAPLALVAGQRYYLEALHKESSGGDNLSVAWATSPTATPTVIPGSRLSPFALPAARVAQAAEAAVEPGLTLQVQPNPFSERTQVSFTSGYSERAVLELYDLRGMRLREVFLGAVVAGQAVSVAVDGTGLAQGLYLLRLKTASQATHQRLLLLR